MSTNQPENCSLLNNDITVWFWREQASIFLNNGLNQVINAQRQVVVCAIKASAWRRSSPVNRWHHWSEICSFIHATIVVITFSDTCRYVANKFDCSRVENNAFIRPNLCSLKYHDASSTVLDAYCDMTIPYLKGITCHSNEDSMWYCSVLKHSIPFSRAWYCLSAKLISPSHNILKCQSSVLYCGDALSHV